MKAQARHRKVLERRKAALQRRIAEDFPGLPPVQVDAEWMQQLLSDPSTSGVAVAIMAIVGGQVAFCKGDTPADTLSRLVHYVPLKDRKDVILRARDHALAESTTWEDVDRIYDDAKRAAAERRAA